MKIRTLPIGTVIEYQNGKSLIAGYSFREISEKLELCYVVLPHPLGFIRNDRLGLINADDVQIVSLGYKGPEYKLLAKYYDTLRTVASQCTADEMRTYLKKAQMINHGGSRDGN